MALTSIWCCALQDHVTRVTTLRGDIVCVVCSEHEAESGVCAVKTRTYQRGLVAAEFPKNDETADAFPRVHCTLV